MHAPAAYDAGGQLYFTDPNLHRVTRWSSTGGFGDYAFASAFGALGREPGMLWSPFAVAVSQTTGDVFVSSTNTFRTEVSGRKQHSFRRSVLMPPNPINISCQEKALAH